MAAQIPSAEVLHGGVPFPHGTVHAGPVRGTGSLFANRIMFPIANMRGETLAFGGRAMGDAQPKYLNSPETAFFRKGENLFGLDKAAAAIRSAGAFVLVEGYMDVLAMHQAGIANCVAPLGTALTEQQVRLLKRYAQKGTLVFDGDEAGQKATMRAIEMLERQDLIALVVELPGGEDPADFVQRGESDRLRGFLEAPRESFAHLVAKAFERWDRSTAEGREAVRDFLFPFVAAVSSQVRGDGYLSRIAESLDVEAQAVRSDFASWRAKDRGSGPGKARRRKNPGRFPATMFFSCSPLPSTASSTPLSATGALRFPVWMMRTRAPFSWPWRSRFERRNRGWMPCAPASSRRL